MIFALLLSLLNISAHALAPLSTRLQQSGATCTSTAAGDYCEFRIAPGYNQPTVILVPAGMDQPEALILYLHGHRGPCGDSNSTSPTSMAKSFNLLQQTAVAGAGKYVTVFPMSRGNCTDYDNVLVGGFMKYKEWAERVIRPGSNKWVVAGHSGAGRAMANILSKYKDFTRQTEMAALLDAAYGMSNYVGRWAVAAGANRKLWIRSYYATSSPEQGSKQLQAAIPAQAKAIRSGAYGDHCRVPKVDFSSALRTTMELILAKEP
jgi:hypothetical protein